MLLVVTSKSGNFGTLFSEKSKLYELHRIFIFNFCLQVVEIHQKHFKCCLRHLFQRGPHVHWLFGENLSGKARRTCKAALEIKSARSSLSPNMNMNMQQPPHLVAKHAPHLHRHW
jgi:hypothetical protein